MSEISVYTGPTSNLDNQLRIQQAQRSPAYDPVDKMRVSTPQSLIDTDFEYGQQPTKWEQLAMQNNRQSMYYLGNASISISSITGNLANSYQVSIVFTASQALTVGQPFFLEDTLDANANGWAYIVSGSGTTWVLQVGLPVFTTTVYNPTATYGYQGYFYTQCGITLPTTSSFTFSGSTVTVTTSYPHGLAAFSQIFITSTTGPSTATQINGSQVVATVLSPTTFTFINVNGTPSTTIVNVANALTLYARPSGWVETRAFDGSVNFTAGAAVPNQQLIRQTRRYFRYQSGKGIQFSTGSVLKPYILEPNFQYAVQLAGVTASGSGVFTCTSQTGLTTGLQVYVYGTGTGAGKINAGLYYTIATTNPTQFTLSNTSGGSAISGASGSTSGLTFIVPGLAGYFVLVTTKFPHNMAISSFVQVLGADQTAFNGIFQIQGVPTTTSFVYQTLNLAIPSSSPATSAGSFLRLSPYQWYGSRNRIGFFDQQNGLFFEYDGVTLYAVYRNSINQITGFAAVTQGSTVVTGTGTQFTSQVVPGDYIVIRGQSYRVLTVSSDTTMYLSNEYRGVSITPALISKTVDLRIPQSQWFDVMDGSGSASNPSGYNLDLTRVQMWFIDYSWYGAGVARFGIRTTNGAIQMLYAFINNNINYSAYMRSGNLPSHYEQIGLVAITTITSSIGTGDTTLNVVSTAGFNPLGGNIKVLSGGNTGTCEYMAYSSLTATTFTITSRATTGGQNSAQSFTYSATVPVTVEYIAPDTAATLAHWGSSVVMDGGFNNDVSLFFNYGMQTPVATTTNVAIPIMAIRVAPTVDNGTVGTLGAKEVINRLQLQLRELAIYSTNAYLVQFILNGVIGGTSGFTSFASPTQNNTFTSSICQVAVNTNVLTTITGGESIAAFYTNTSGQTTLDLTALSAVGNSILGGGTSNIVPTSQTGTYPDGPDILYVVVQALGSFTLNNFSVTGTAGQISFSLSTPQQLAVGNAVTVSGSSGFIANGTYYVVATNGVSTATLSLTPGGSGAVTTIGTPTGTFTAIASGTAQARITWQESQA
jgi:hypothetical protein